MVRPAQLHNTQVLPTRLPQFRSGASAVVMRCAHSCRPRSRAAAAVAATGMARCRRHAWRRCALCVRPAPSQPGGNPCAQKPMSAARLQLLRMRCTSWRGVQLVGCAHARRLRAKTHTVIMGCTLAANDGGDAYLTRICPAYIGAGLHVCWLEPPSRALRASAARICGRMRAKSPRDLARSRLIKHDVTPELMISRRVTSQGVMSP